jgi:hypothetical protein
MSLKSVNNCIADFRFEPKADMSLCTYTGEIAPLRLERIFGVTTLELG